MSRVDEASGATVATVAPFRKGLAAIALGVVAVVWTLAYTGFSFAGGTLAWDVRFAYVPAAESVLAGESPYPEIDDPILEEQKGYVYPPQLVVAVLPLAALPIDVVAALVAAVMVALVLGTLHVLGVRDLRCHGAVLLWMPTTSGVLLSNVSIPLAFALALVWRYRHAARACGLVLGLAVSAKLLLWPMFVWTVAMRRVRATVWAVTMGLAVTFAAWAALGFAGLGTYPDLLERLSEIQSTNSYSLAGMAATLGLGDVAGQAATLLVGASLLFLCVLFARRGDDYRSFTSALAATLALTPIVWLHYLVALVVPLAIARPRFSFLWLLPVALVVSPRPGYPEGVEVFLPAIVATAVLVRLLMRPLHPLRPRVSSVGGKNTASVTAVEARA